MLVRRLTKFALLALCLAIPAFAQKAPAPGTHISVSKAAPSDNNPEGGMFRTIQAAVNAAKPGQVIEILDDGIYEEQVTIDGRETSPWPGVTGGKDGITIRYVPPANAPPNFARPTIKYRDTQNRSPKTYAESRTDGELPGSSGNFETCGTLRIIRAQGVTIDGIAVDGGGAAPFGWPSIWNSKDPLFHGNAAITIVVASGAVIRNCDLKNAYFGVNVKDRNTGGVFGNPNPADNDQTIPLSGFGKVGNHLIEYNRVHGNSIGFFFESAWDLGSSVRYNLIYNNYHTTATEAEITRIGIEVRNRATGAFLFKDLGYSPVAIYNNTFYNNYANFYADWKVGAPHLIFNNIYGKSSEAVGTQLEYVDAMGIDHKFPFRMNNCLFSALADLKAEKVHVSGCSNTSVNPPIYGGQEVLGITQVRISNSFPNPTVDGLTTVNCLSPIENQTATTDRITPHGSRIAGGEAGIPTSANLRWLETSKSVEGTEDLFVSTDTLSRDFLRPNWDHPLVIEFIKNKGWMTTPGATGRPGAGIRNSDGAAADIGAIPSTGRAPATVARIRPSSIVKVSGTTARAGFYITVEPGQQFNNPKIRFLRWVTPLPAVLDADWGASQTRPVPDASIHDITPPNTVFQVGTNTLNNITVPALTATDTLGFFELTIEGTDATGKVVTSDVGFLPYRKLDYTLNIQVIRNGQPVTGKPVVNAGEPVTLRVTALEKGASFERSNFTRPLAVEYQLISSPTSRMWQQITPRLDNPLVYEPDLRTGASYSKTYTVYFTKAGDEVVSGGGRWCDMDCNDKSALVLPFLGDLELTVKPGVPDKVVFLQPIPKSQIPAGVNPPTISGTYNVEVQVQDKFDNPVDVAVPVGIVSSDATIGDIDAPQTASTSAADGIARFTARAGNAKPNDIFDLIATMTYPGASKVSDTASLRVGRVMDILRVFYHNTGKNGNDWHDDYDDPYNEINESVDSRVQVWVKLMHIGGDTVITSRDANICVTASHPKIKFSPTEGGAASGQYFGSLRDGVASFWITADTAVDNATLDAVAKQLTATDCNGTNDNGVSPGSRGGVTFIKPDAGVGPAFVRGDRYARPNYVEITFTGAWSKPDSVTLQWPGTCDNAPTVTGTNIEDIDDVTIGVTFPPEAFPEGYSSILNPTTAAPLVSIYGAIEAGSKRSPVKLVDNIGPLIARVRANPYCGAAQFINPTFKENSNRGVTPDVLTLQTTEFLIDFNSLVGQSLWISRDSVGTGETALTVLSARPNGEEYELTISPETPLTKDYWIRFNDKHPGIVDIAGNKPLPNNRPVRIYEEEVAAVISSAWYTVNDATGKADAVYITFDKSLTAADIPVWFGGGSFSFDWNGGGIGSYSVPADDATSVIRMYDSVQNTIRVDLSTNEAERDKMLGGIIRTSGNVAVTVTFGPNKTGWGSTRPEAAVDKARPVLISAVLQIGSFNADKDDYDLDTLMLTFSENPTNGITAIADPVKIKVDGVWTDVALQVPSPLTSPMTQVSGTPHYLVRYVVTLNGIDNKVKGGDSVMINVAAGVSDAMMPPNVQGQADNHRVLLKIIPGKPNWDTKVKNNPFWDFVVVETTPNAKGDKLDVVGYISLYDNMGKLVMSDTVNNVNAAGNAVAWRWEGRNKNGRYVGTGTYLFKARYTAKNKEIDVEPKIVTKAIGFVRR